MRRRLITTENLSKTAAEQQDTSMDKGSEYILTILWNPTENNYGYSSALLVDSYDCQNKLCLSKYSCPLEMVTPFCITGMSVEAVLLV